MPENITYGGATNGAQTVEIPSATIRAFFETFKIAAVAVLADGTVAVSRDIARLRPPPMEA
jgi:hypothetical protein